MLRVHTLELHADSGRIRSSLSLIFHPRCERLLVVCVCTIRLSKSKIDGVFSKYFKMSAPCLYTNGPVGSLRGRKTDWF